MKLCMVPIASYYGSWSGNLCAGLVGKDLVQPPARFARWGLIMTMTKNVYSTVYSQAVTHPSTNTAQPCLTSVIGRELVYSR